MIHDLTRPEQAARPRRSARPFWATLQPRTAAGRFVVANLGPAVLFALLLPGRAAALQSALSAPDRGTGDELVRVATFAYQASATLFIALVIGLFLMRRAAVARCDTWHGALVAIGAVLAPFAMEIPAVASPSALLLALSSAVASLGLAVAIGGLSSLRRNFGILPEARGLTTSGLYRFVRHPVYLGEMVALGALVLPLATPRNLLVLLGVWGLQILRTYYEEAVLARQFPSYAEYQRRTRRLLPGLY